MAKRRFTLLEILIAISIAGILFAILFSKIREHVFLRRDLKNAHQECLERQTLHIRLLELFAGLSPSEEKGEFKAPLSSKNGQIHFVINVPLDIHSSELGMHSCKLWHESSSELVYLTSENASGKEKSEILARKVKKMSSRFFSVEKGAWLNEWPEGGLEIPAFIIIQCKKESGEMEFLFPLNQLTIDFDS